MDREDKQVSFEDGHSSASDDDAKAVEVFQKPCAPIAGNRDGANFDMSR